MKTDTNFQNLIVLGNGFDLACGEKTSVYDFVQYELKKPMNSFGYYRWNFIVFLLRIIFEESNNAEELINLLDLKQSDVSDWMDFEKIIHHLVLNEKVFNNFKDIYEFPEKYMRQDTAYLKKLISMYFQNFREWHDKQFNCGESFVDFLENVVSEFEQQLQSYLVNIDVDKTIYAHKQLLLEVLRGGYEKTSVMDFNYTRLPYDMFKHPVYYIHGNARVCCIVGIDPYFKNPGSTDLYKTLGQKIHFTKLYKRLNYYSKEELRQPVLNKNINRITFFGHSLGEQDYSYFQSIFDFFELYSSDVVLIFCYMEYDADNKTKEIERVTNRVFNLINRYGETLTNKDHGNNLLNKLLLEGRIVFKEIDSDKVFVKEKIDNLLKLYEYD